MASATQTEPAELGRARSTRALTALVLARPVLAYFVLTFVIAWGGAILAALVGPGHVPATAEEFRPVLPYAMLVGFAAPAVSGLLLTSLIDGRAGVRELRERLLTWQVAAHWYAIALLGAPLAVLAVLLPLSLAAPDFTPAVFTTNGPVILVLIGLGAGLVAGGLEELGWTGFAVPRLRARHSVLATGLLVGFVWGAWHFSYIVMRGSQTGGLDLALFLPEMAGMFLVVLPAFRVLLVWLHDRTGSLLLTMIMHGSLSATTGLILAPDVRGGSLAVYYLTVGALVWIAAGAAAKATEARGCGADPRELERGCCEDRTRTTVAAVRWAVPGPRTRVLR